MSSTSSTKLFEGPCDECAVSIKRKFVAYSKMRYHRSRKLFNGMRFDEWKKTSGTIHLHLSLFPFSSNTNF